MTPITLQGLVVQFSACYDLPYSRVEVLRKILMTIFLKEKKKEIYIDFNIDMCYRCIGMLLSVTNISGIFFFFGYIEKDRATRMIYYN